MDSHDITGKHSRVILGAVAQFCSGSGSFFEGYFQLLRIFVFLSKFCVTFLAGSQLAKSRVDLNEKS